MAVPVRRAAARRRHPRGRQRLAGQQPRPAPGIHVAVNRVAPDSDGAPAFLPAERLSLTEALTAYTAGSAYVNHLDGTGQVRAGTPADLVVLDRDPFAGPPEAIARTRVALTFAGGQEVYAAHDA